MKRRYRKKLIIAAGLVLAALVASPVLAQDMSGSWEITSQTPRGEQTMTLVVEQSGSELTGTVTMARMGRPGGGGGGGDTAGRGPMEVEISDGTVSDGDFSFTLTLGRGGRSISQTFTGRFEGGEMSGMITGGPRGGERPFTGVRGSTP